MSRECFKCGAQCLGKGSDMAWSSILLWLTHFACNALLIKLTSSTVLEKLAVSAYQAYRKRVSILYGASANLQCRVKLYQMVFRYNHGAKFTGRCVKNSRLLEVHIYSSLFWTCSHFPVLLYRQLGSWNVMPTWTKKSSKTDRSLHSSDEHFTFGSILFKLNDVTGLVTCYIFHQNLMNGFNSCAEGMLWKIHSNSKVLQMSGPHLGVN